MRVMVFGKSKRRTRKVAHIVRAFRDLGHKTLWVNPSMVRRWLGVKADKFILLRARYFKPHIVFFMSTDIPMSVLADMKRISPEVKIFQFYVDAWRLDDIPRVAKWGALADYFLVTAKGLNTQYRSAGICNPVFFTDACDKYDHKVRVPMLSMWKSDLAFVGAARSGEARVSLVQRLSKVCGVRVYGRDWHKFGIRATLGEVGPRGFALICSGAKIVLGADATSKIEGHWSNRLWLTLGCGGFLLTNYVPGMEEIFRNREHLVWYRDEDECEELVREYLAKPEERRRIAEAGYRYVHEHHTFHHFVDRVMGLYNQDRPQT